MNEDERDDYFCPYCNAEGRHNHEEDCPIGPPSELPYERDVDAGDEDDAKA